MRFISIFFIATALFFTLTHAHWPHLFVEVSTPENTKLKIGPNQEVIFTLTHALVNAWDKIGKSGWRNEISWVRVPDNHIQEVKACFWKSSHPDWSSDWYPLTNFEFRPYNPVTKSFMLRYEFNTPEADGLLMFPQYGLHYLKCSFTFGSVPTGAFVVNIEQDNLNGPITEHGYWSTKRGNLAKTAIGKTAAMENLNPIYIDLWDYTHLHTIGGSVSGFFDRDCNRAATQLKKIGAQASDYLKQNNITIKSTSTKISLNCGNSTTVPTWLLPKGFTSPNTDVDDVVDINAPRANAFVIIGLNFGATISSDTRDTIIAHLAEFAETHDLTMPFLQTDATFAVGSSQYVIPAECQDGIKTGVESDVDCGGAAKTGSSDPIVHSCLPCAAKKACITNTDCRSGICSDVGQCLGEANAMATSAIGALIICLIGLIWG